MKEHIVIVGGGQAAAHAINEIRKINTDCSLSLISEEKELPYERPPLSKEYITQEKNLDDFLFFDKQFYQSKDVNVKLNLIVENIDFDNCKLNIDNNPDIFFDKLLICTGSKNKLINIQGLNSQEIFQLRNLQESKNIIKKAKEVENIVIVGGGFIGLEIASSLSKLNKNITVIEAANQIMGRAIPKEIAELILTKHQKNNVRIILENKILNILKSKNIYEVTLSNNEIIKTEMLIAGIGVEPQIDLLKETNLKVENGIVTNEFCNTSANNVYAAGDVCNFYHPFYDKYMRLESWKHAQDHGIIAGKNILGQKNIYDEIPWMWSNQYDLNIQLTGIIQDYDNIVKRGKDIEAGIVYFYLKNNKIIAACGVGLPGKVSKEIRLASIFSKKKKQIDEKKLSDKSQDLKKI
jgi:3-phenylpropionate/trans-cinnamate dioxygenase ferredoxin reductase subunit